MIEAELPDGTVLEFPDGTDQAVIQKVVKQRLGVSATTPQANAESQRVSGLPANRFAPQGQIVTGGQQMARLDQEREAFLQSLSPERRAQLESIGGLEALGIAAGKGMTDIARGVGLMPQATEDEKRIYGELERLHPVSAGVGEAAGQSAPFLVPGLGVAGIASTPARVAATAALGASEGGIISRGQGGDLGQQFLSAGIGGTVAGALELGLPIVGRMAGKLYRKLTGTTPKGAVIDAAGRPSAEMLEALQKNGIEFDDLVQDAAVELKGSVVDPEQAARKAFLESQGIQPTQAQVTQRATDFMQQQELAKQSSKVRSALQKQNATLTTRFNNAVLETGGRPDRPTNTVVDAITERATRLDNEIGRLYKMARDAAPDQKNVRFDSLDAMVKKLMPQNRKGGYNIEALVGELKEQGIYNSKNQLVGKIDVNTAEQIRQTINDLYDPSNPFGNIQLRMLKERLDDDVFKSAGQDVFAQARKAKFQFERDLIRSKLSKFDSRRANLVRDVLENKISPDTFVKDVVFSKRWRAEDLSQLKTYLEAEDAGKSAFNDLRSEVLTEIRDRAFKGAQDENGLTIITRNRLESALNALGDDKMAVLFKPEEKKFFDDMLKVTKLLEPVSGTALGEGPTGAAVNRLRKQISKLGILSDVIDQVVISQNGKLAIRAAPEKVINPVSGSAFRQAAGLGAAAAATQQAENQ